MWSCVHVCPSSWLCIWVVMSYVGVRGVWDRSLGLHLCPHEHSWPLHSAPGGGGLPLGSPLSLPRSIRRSVSGSVFLWACVPPSEVGSLWEVVGVPVGVCVGSCFHRFSCTLVLQGLVHRSAWGIVDLGPTSPPFLFLQQEGDAITLKPRPSADMTNSSAPSPSHKVQRSVSANPKQRRFSDQGERFGECCGDSPLLRGHKFPDFG